MQQLENTKNEKEQLTQRLAKIKNKFIIISGKGGVGKSTVSVNLAYSLAKKGFQTGILDVDLHGPNVGKMLGFNHQKLIQSENGIEPIQIINNLKAISMAFMLESQDQPVIWRGPLKYNAIKQFISDVNWGTLDYLIIDSPPGTGDEPLSVCQIINDITGAIIVTTPQEVAILDARKSVVFSKQINVPVVGIIENMSDIECPHCQKEIKFFGKGGGKKAADDLQVPYIGSIPIEPAIVTAGDEGKPFIHFNKGTQAAEHISKIVDKIKQFKTQDT